MKTLYIDGNNFNDIETFQQEMLRLFAPNESWTKLGLDGFNDVLHGGFGVFDEDEQITIIWLNHEKSMKNLGYPATIKYREERLANGHPANESYLQEKLSQAKAGQGKTYYDEVIEVLTEHHDQITLALQ